MKKENLNYEEMIKLIEKNVDDTYNLRVCFEREYKDHMACEGTDTPFIFKFDKKEFEITGQSKILNENTDIEEIVTMYSIEFEDKMYSEDTWYLGKSRYSLEKLLKMYKFDITKAEKVLNDMEERLRKNHKYNNYYVRLDENENVYSIGLAFLSRDNKFRFYRDEYYSTREVSKK